MIGAIVAGRCQDTLQHALATIFNITLADWCRTHLIITLQASV